VEMPVAPLMPSAASSAARSLSKVPLRASARRKTCGVGGGTAGDAVALRAERGPGTEPEEPGIGVSGCDGGVGEPTRGVAAVPGVGVTSAAPARGDGFAGALRAADAFSEAGDPVRAGTDA
jgi:hypothetical protein